MATFKDVPIDETFSFPDPAPASGIARLGLCVKISARRYQALGRPEVYTIGTTKAEVTPRGENTPIRYR